MVKSWVRPFGMVLLILQLWGCNRTQPNASIQEVEPAKPSEPSTPASPSATTSIAEQLYEGEIAAQQQLAKPVIAAIEAGITPDQFETGDVRYDGEWALGSYQMAALGLGQLITAHPDLKPDYLPLMRQAVEQMLRPELNAFGTDAWNGEIGLDSLDNGAGHAYLGYTNLALSMLRLHDPDNGFAAINDALTAALLSRLKADPYGQIETYPGETYPADIAAVIGSIALHQQATEAQNETEISELLTTFRSQMIDEETGMVLQRIDSTTGARLDTPRASGTTLSAYYLNFADSAIASQLLSPIWTRQLLKTQSWAGVLEYPPEELGTGDIDSGKLVYGMSPSATIFALGGARITSDRTLYQQLYQTIDGSKASLLAEQAALTTLLESPLGVTLRLALATADPMASQLDLPNQ